jgi:DNA-directed RNA polymerase subunit RPC12/RpoP
VAELSDLVGGKKMAGSYSCQSCDFVVTNSEWDIANKKLSWVCPQCKHKSMIDFQLG